MLVKDIIKLVATILQDSDLVKYLNSLDDEQSSSDNSDANVGTQASDGTQDQTNDDDTSQTNTDVSTGGDETIVDNITYDEDEFNLLLACVNLVNNTIATDYIKLTDVVSVSNDADKILFSDLTNKNILDIVSVKDKFGSSLKFNVETDGLIVPHGDIKIKFAYFPELVGIEDKIDCYTTHMTERVFAYGVLSEYFYIKGNFNDASMWDVRFKQALLSITAKLGEIKMPKRLWVWCFTTIT